LNFSTDIYVLLGTEPWTLGYRAYDDIEGDITGRVVVGGDYPDFTQLGSFVVTYDVSDLDGNQAEQRVITITVVESYDDINR
jgi:hypothetical protein